MTGRPLRGRTRSLGRYTTRIHRTLPQDRPRGAGLQVRQTRGAPAGGCRRRPSAPRAPHAPAPSRPGVCDCGALGGGAWSPPWLRPARHLGRERRPCGAAGREGGRRGEQRAGKWEPGNLESWEPAGLQGCARQVYSFSGFQVFTLPGPAPAGGVARGAASCNGPTERRETGT